MLVAPHVSNLRLYTTLDISSTFLKVSLNRNRLPIVLWAFNAMLNSTWEKLLLTLFQAKCEYISFSKKIRINK